MWLPLIVIVAILLILALSKKISSYRKSMAEKPSPEKKDESKIDTSKKKKTFPFGTIITLAILGAVGYGAYYFISHSHRFIGTEKRSERPAPEMPLCAGGYDFSEINLPAEVKLNFQTECKTPVKLSPHAEALLAPDAIVEVIFINGDKLIDGPEMQNDASNDGIGRSQFKVRGLEKSGTMKIILRISKGNRA